VLWNGFRLKSSIQFDEPLLDQDVEDAFPPFCTFNWRINFHFKENVANRDRECNYLADK
jgi:hypothetical protein